MTSIKWILVYAIRLYSLVLLGRILTTWVDPGMQTPVAQFLFRLTEPVLAPIRRVLPQSGPLDFSPLIVFLLLSVFAQIVASI